MFWVSGGYALLTAAICAFEVRRTRDTGADILSVFIVIIILECCLPGVVIFACLPFSDPSGPTDNPAFDRIFAASDVWSALLVLGLTAWFVFFLYAFMSLGDRVMRRFIVGSPTKCSFLLYGSRGRLLLLLSLGVALTLTGFWLLGDTWVDRYANMILLRGYSENVERNTLDAFASGLTQTWGWLSVIALFVIFERRGRSFAWYCCIVCAILFAVLGVSRRAIFIPVLLAYFTMVLFDGRWRVKLIVAASIPILLWVAFGKEAFSAVAYGGSAAGIIERYEGPAAGILRTASDVGVTVVESVGSISLLDIPARFGTDHVLSLIRGAPIGWMLHWAGHDDILPERIVRLSTEAFSSSDAQDIPPGLFGEMWLDFRIFGPMIWAFVFAVQLSVVQRVFTMTVRTREAISVLVVITFIIALPINTGSYDFSFGPDIVALVLCLFAAFKVVRVRLGFLETSEIDARADP